MIEPLGCAYYGCVFPKGHILSTSLASCVLALTLFASLVLGQTNPCEKARDFQADIDRWTKVLEKDPTNVAALIGRGTAFHDAQKPVLARKDLNKAIELAPSSAEAYRARGELEVTLGRYEQAIEDLTKSILFDPTSGKAYYIRGLAYQFAEKPGPALGDFRMTSEFLEDDYLGFVGVGNVYARQREKDLGALWLNRAIEILDRKISAADPAKCNAYLFKFRGHAAISAFRFNDAFRDLNETLKQDASEDEAHYYRAWVYHAINARDHALTDINRAIELYATRAQYYDLRAQIYERLNNKQAAEADRAKIKELGEIK